MKYKVFEKDKKLFSFFSENLQVGDKIHFDAKTYKVIDRMFICAHDYNEDFMKIEVERLLQRSNENEKSR